MVKLKDLPERELLLPGHAACPGCPMALSLRILLKVLGPKTILVIPACCTSVIQGFYPTSSINVPVLNMAFAASAAAASGLSRALRFKGRDDIHVVAWAGDGGTADIGLAAISGAAERNEDMIYVCYDNEAYMNTGIQRSGATPYGAWTTTTVTGKTEHKKDVPMILEAHKIPYIATACISYPLDFAEKVKRAASIKGFRYIHLLAPCPPGWRFPAHLTIKVGQLAVQTGMWALYEVVNGKFQLSPISRALLDKSKRKPVEEYLKLQGRFAKLSKAEIEELQRYVDEQWKRYAILQKLSETL